MLTRAAYIRKFSQHFNLRGAHFKERRRLPAPPPSTLPHLGRYTVLSLHRTIAFHVDTNIEHAKRLPFSCYPALCSPPGYSISRL